MANSGFLDRRPPLHERGRPVAWSRLAFTLCAIVVFTVQSCVLQAHIHPSHTAELTANLVPHTGQPNPGGREDGDDCPLCQAFALAGAYLTPGAVLFRLPALQFLTLSMSAWNTIEGRAAQIHWRSRAPPAWRPQANPRSLP